MHCHDMEAQNQLKRTLSQSSNLERVRNLIDEGTVAHRSELAKTVCEQYGFHDARGEVQLSGCLKALRELEAEGHFVLPAAQKKTGPSSFSRLGEAVPQPKDVPVRAGEVKGLTLVLVETTEQMRTWNELMIDEHPQGAGPLVGRQLRYLIDSENGWLGGLGFAAAALQLADRDRWIGWDAEQRRAHLDRIVGMSRYLIRPGVKCRNLASKVLSMGMARLPDDFHRR